MGGPSGSADNKSPQEVAKGLVEAGSDVIGTNCFFDPTQTLACLALMKEGIDPQDFNKSVFLGCQPVAFKTPDPDVEFLQLPEYPLAMEARKLSRTEGVNYARAATELVCGTWVDAAASSPTTSVRFVRIWVAPCQPPIKPQNWVTPSHLSCVPGARKNTGSIWSRAKADHQPLPRCTPGESSSSINQGHCITILAVMMHGHVIFGGLGLRLPSFNSICRRLF